MKELRNVIMNNELWGIFKLSGHIEDYLRYVMGDEKFDDCFNISHEDSDIKEGDIVDRSNTSDGYSA